MPTSIGREGAGFGSPWTNVVESMLNKTAFARCHQQPRQGCELGRAVLCIAFEAGYGNIKSV
jgi:hypothetical protein